MSYKILLSWNHPEVEPFRNWLISRGHTTEINTVDVNSVVGLDDDPEAEKRILTDLWETFAYRN